PHTPTSTTTISTLSLHDALPISKCIPIVATQSISSLKSTLSGDSYRTLLQTFRTKIFLALSDDFSTRMASDLCGREDKPFVTYNISESGQNSKLSLLTAKTV